MADDITAHALTDADFAPCHADTLGRTANAGIICEACRADPR